MNDFSALLDELAQLQAGTEDLAKAMKTEDAEDDAKIAAAADTDGDGKAEGADEAPTAGDKDDADDKDADYFGKSMRVKLDDGTEVEAFDGTAAIHGLHERIDSLAQRIDGLAGGDVMAKALGSVGGAVKGMQALIKEQGDMLKALRAEVATLRSSGAGRKATLSVHEKPTAAPAAPEGDAPDVIMSKAMTAQAAGKVTAREVATLESYFGRGLKPPADLLAKIA